MLHVEEISSLVEQIADLVTSKLGLSIPHFSKETRTCRIYNSKDPVFDPEALANSLRICET